MVSFSNRTGERRNGSERRDFPRVCKDRRQQEERRVRIQGEGGPDHRQRGPMLGFGTD